MLAPVTVEAAVAKVLEGYTKVRFAGRQNDATRWPTCEAQSLGVRITVADARPRSEVGQQWASRPGQPLQERPTAMRLNFRMGGAYAAYCSIRRQHCVEVTSVHEFMHAIGFLHEHLRTDAPSDCQERFKHDADDLGLSPVHHSVAYDAASIMNYCESIYRTPVRLSALDIEAVDYFYARQ